MEQKQSSAIMRIKMIKAQYLPACICRGDGNEWRCPQGEAGGSRLGRLGLRFPLTVVLLSLPEGQRGQLDGSAGKPADRKGLHAGEWT